MKRTKHIDLTILRKNTPVRFFSAPLALAVATVIAGCQPQKEYQLVQSTSSCVENTELTLEQCEAAYQNALKEAERTAPKYASRYNCETEFDNCQQSSSGVWLPLMAGFMVARALDNVGDNASARRYGRAQYYNPVFHYSGNRRGLKDKLMLADGRVIGIPGKRNYKLNPTVTKPRPTVTRTVSRGGFGSTASAKSNWGGSRSGGWGG